MPDTPTFDPNIQTEDIAFRSDELVNCPKCARQNPPNRFKCVYCGVAIEVKGAGSADAKLVLRKLETWEPGFNVVVTATSESDIARAAKLLNITSEYIEKMIAADTPLPIARVEGEQEAQIVLDKLNAFGFAGRNVADADLAPEKPLTRLSGLALEDDVIALIDLNTHEPRTVSLAELALIVTGTIATSKTDSMEKRKRGGKTKVLDEASFSTDASLIDLYLRNDPMGFRIWTTGFDFSCLGEDMGIIASENMRLLIVALKEAAPQAKLVINYDAIRHLLDDVWETESRKDPQGLVRSGFGKKEFGMSASTNNLTQFTKYSRMQWQLL